MWYQIGVASFSWRFQGGHIDSSLAASEDRKNKAILTVPRLGQDDKMVKPFVRAIYKGYIELHLFPAIWIGFIYTHLKKDRGNLYYKSFTWMFSAILGRFPLLKPSKFGVSSAEVAINCQEMYWHYIFVNLTPPYPNPRNNNFYKRNIPPYDTSHFIGTHTAIPTMIFPQLTQHSLQSGPKKPSKLKVHKRSRSMVANSRSWRSCSRGSFCFTLSWWEGEMVRVGRRVWWICVCRWYSCWKWMLITGKEIWKVSRIKRILSFSEKKHIEYIDIIHTIRVPPLRWIFGASWCFLKPNHQLAPSSFVSVGMFIYFHLPSVKLT